MPLFLQALMALGPVALFLAALVLLDGYKLVRLRMVLAVLAFGMAAAAAAYFGNGFLLERLPIGYEAYTRYLAPVIEELLKALVIVALIRTHRIGFLVDAAILGFAAGAGFALVENLLYLRQVPDAGGGMWLVRGFGTAIMHGGATAAFAVLGRSILERSPDAGIAALLPGFALAAILHSAFNHFLFSPVAATAGIVIVVPLVLYVVFDGSQAAISDWLGRGFDSDTEMLELINSGRLSDSPTGRYLQELTTKFHGPVVADLLCYLRLHTELALRAKGLLLMRENGFEVPIDDETREKFAEMRYLEQSIGQTGRLALRPLLHMSHRELWQLFVLGER